jgi:hypothetical protein
LLFLMKLWTMTCYAKEKVNLYRSVTREGEFLE